MADYSFVTEWLFDAPVERVFAEIQAAEDWPAFWKGVRRVEVLSRPEHGLVGTRTRNTWRSVLPYTLTFDAEVIAAEAPRRLELRADGELSGSGRWELEPTASGTRVTYHWNVATTRAWMNLLAPLLRPLFKWNHDVVMHWGYQGLRKRLREAPGPSAHSSSSNRSGPSSKLRASASAESAVR